MTGLTARASRRVRRRRILCHAAMNPAVKPVARPVVLLILDGFGCRADAPDNAITRARMPNWDRLLASCPHTSIDASELDVGLPAGQMGNSEVGHLNIGAGRVVYQDFTRIDHAIATGEFARNPVLTDGRRRREGQRRGGPRAGARLARRRPQPRAPDRRDGGACRRERRRAARLRPRLPRRPRHAAQERRRRRSRSSAASARGFAGARIASICGRYYAMDRDKRWERSQAAYDLLVDGRAAYSAPDPQTALAAAYARGETDEFVQADGDRRRGGPRRRRWRTATSSCS